MDTPAKQKTFSDFDNPNVVQPKKFWCWRVEYRIKLDDKWSEWCVALRRPNVFTRKADAEKQLAKMTDRHKYVWGSVSDHYQHAVRPHYLGHELSVQRRNLKELKRRWRAGIGD